MSVKTIGITGGIGSGKTTASKIFQLFNIPVFEADKYGHLILQKETVKEQIKNLFGQEVFNANNEIDRKKLGEIVFTKSSKLNKLNSIIHPAVSLAFEEWKAKKKNAAILLYEAAILFETGAYKKFDATILVTSPESLRLARVMKRDNVSKQEVIKRMEKQWSDEEKSKFATWIIENNEEISLIEQVQQVYKKL